jgi:guanylate kinase
VSGSPRRGLPFVISAPSGTGKTTVCHRVVSMDPDVVLSVSHTTRAPRPSERDGVDYHFVTEARFEQLVAEDAFLEHARYSGHRYGTSWAAIEEPLAAGRDVLLEIETQGARQVRSRRRDALLIFLLPPSLAELERRLRGRRSGESGDEIERRLAIARHEFGAAPLFDVFVVNREVEGAADAVLALVRAARRGALAGLAPRFSLAAVRAQLDPALASWLPDRAGAAG